MSFESPLERNPICAWTYDKKAEDFHLPIFLILTSSAPLRCRAIAPPARREWLLTFSGGMPWAARLRPRAASLTAEVM